MLRVRGIEAGYGAAPVLHGLSFDVAPGSVLALLGRNGAGKSTALKTIAGLIAPARGTIDFEGAPLAGLPPHRVSRRGVAYVPEERRIFAHLTVDEHLAIAARSGGWPRDRAYALFPALEPLRRRRGDALSGGEQQMLAIARALATGPRLLLLDEPSQGLAPVVADAVADALGTLRGEGLAIVLVEQNVEMALDLADAAIVIDRGAIVFAGTNAQLRERPDIAARYVALG